MKKLSKAEKIELARTISVDDLLGTFRSAACRSIAGNDFLDRMDADEDLAICEREIKRRLAVAEGRC